MENALDHLDQDHSSRREAAWLVEKTSKEISLQGIVNIWTAHRGPESDNPSALLKQRIKDRKKAAPKGKEAKKIAARNGYYNYFDDTNQVDKPFDWSGHCQIYKGHLGWNVEYGSENMLVEDVSHYDAIEDDEKQYENISNGDVV